MGDRSLDAGSGKPEGETPTSDDSSTGDSIAEPLSPADFARPDPAEASDTAPLDEPRPPQSFTPPASSESDEPRPPESFAAPPPVDPTPAPPSEPRPPRSFNAPAAEPPPVELSASEPPPPVAKPGGASADADRPASVEFSTKPLQTRSDTIYRLPAENVRIVYVLAMVQAVLTIVVAAPALQHLGLRAVPGWAWIVLLLAALELLYVLWVVSLPDWSTVWLGALVFGLTAGVHALGFALCVTTAVENRPLGLDRLSSVTTGWCGTIAILCAGMAAACVWISSPWRSEYEEWKKRPVAPRAKIRAG